MISENLADWSALLSSVARTLVSRAVAAQGGILLSFVVGNLIGVEGLGYVTLSMTIAVGVSTFTRFGLDQFILRHGSVAIQRSSARDYFDLVRTSLALVSTAAVTFAFVVALVVNFSPLVIRLDKISEHIMYSALLSAPVYSVVYNQAAWLKAHKLASVSPLFEVSAISGVGALLIMLGYFYGLRDGALEILCLYALPVAAIIVAVGGWVLLRTVRARTLGTNEYKGRIKINFRNDLSEYYAISIAMYVVGWAPFLILGFFAGSDEVGLYSVAYRLAFSLNFILTAFSGVLAPRFAQIYDLGRKEQLLQLLRRSAVYSLAAGGPVAVVFLVFGDSLLMFFGEGFSAAYSVLAVLVSAQLINLSTGCANVMLNMTGHQRLLRRAVFQAAVLLSISSAFLMPLFGALGGAFCSLLATSYLNIRCVVYATSVLSPDRCDRP